MDICDGARKVAMGTIHRLETGTAVPTLGQACEAFLAGIANPDTAALSHSGTTTATSPHHTPAGHCPRPHGNTAPAEETGLRRQRGAV